MKEYISSKSNLLIEKMDVNGKVFLSTSDHFNKFDDIWITISDNDMTAEKKAAFGKSITAWSKENGLVLN